MSVTACPQTKPSLSRTKTPSMTSTPASANRPSMVSQPSPLGEKYLPRSWLGNRSPSRSGVSDAIRGNGRQEAVASLLAAVAGTPRPGALRSGLSCQALPKEGPRRMAAPLPVCGSVLLSTNPRTGLNRRSTLPRQTGDGYFVRSAATGPSSLQSRTLNRHDSRLRSSVSVAVLARGGRVRPVAALETRSGSGLRPPCQLRGDERTSFLCSLLLRRIPRPPSAEAPARRRPTVPLRGVPLGRVVAAGRVVDTRCRVWYW